MPPTVAEAQESLYNACVVAGISVESAELIRLGSNAVYRLNSDLIGRVSPDLSLWASAERQIQIARWLDRVGYPATRALPVEQPINGTGRVVTLWESVCRSVDYAPIGDVARLIRDLHALDAPPDIDLPLVQPFGAPGDELPELADLSRLNRDHLRERIERARVEFRQLPFVLSYGVIHGDANVGNVLRADDGHAVLIDLDGFAIGPREWDLIQTALFYDRFGWHTEEEYRTFVEVYGYDLLEWEGYPDLADMREVAMTTWLGRKAGESEATAAEAEKRVTAMRTGASRQDWIPY